jgi:hypothetical protein
MQVTGNSQQPWVSASPIRGTFHFVISGEITISPPTAGKMSEAAEAWAATQNSTSIGVLQAFADRYSSTVYGRMARARIEELKRVTAAPIPGSSRLQTAEVAPPVRPNLPCTSHSPAGVSLSSRAARPLSVDEECALKPKDVFRECDKCPDLVVVPAGTFTMGAPANEPDGSDRERPQHVVTIAQPLAVGKFAVTVDQFEAFIKDTHGQAGSSCRTLEGGKMEERTGRPRLSLKRRTSGGMHQLRRCRSLRALAIDEDRQALPTVDRGRVGICRASGDHDTLFLRQR